MARKAEKRGPMQVLELATVTTLAGIEGDFRGSLARRERQLTLIALDQWREACEIIGRELMWHERRCNICLAGIEFNGQHVGQHLRLNGVIVQITGETTPCQRMDDVYPGLRAALTPDWRGGVTCRVIRGGELRIGDEVRWTRHG